MKKIVLFDLDGTLLDTLEDLTDSTNFALESLNYSKKSILEIRSFVGNGVAKLIKRALPLDVSAEQYEKCLEIFKNHYRKNMYNKTKPYDGIITMLENLKTKKIKIGIISNKFDLAVKELCAKYFSGLYDIALGENEAKGICKKPSPDLVLKVLENYKIDKHNSIYIGDSEIDIQTANNAGIGCISVLWGFKDEKFLKENNAKIFVHAPNEILKYLE